jgi:Spy/CpxP family protein refolding chaperone
VPTVIIRQLSAVVVAGVPAAAGLAVSAQQRPPVRPVQNQTHDGGQRGDGRRTAPQVPQRAKWWQDAKIQTDLHLTADQSTRIDEVFQSFFNKMKGTADELSRREEELSKLISGSNDVTEVRLLREADQVEFLRGTLGKNRTLMLFRMRRVLTPEQRNKLAEIQRAQEQERRAVRSSDRSQ